VKTKFKKGPWKIWPTHWAGGNKSTQVNGENAMWVESTLGGQICALFHHGPHRYSPTDEDMANAHLIAAAPELYEALERMIESSACTNGCDPGDMTCDTMFAKYALAKARGES
jgi:hypothetical protein